MRTNPAAELVRKIEYLKELREAIVRLRSAGRSVGAIRRKLFPKPMVMEALTLADFSGGNLVRAFLKEAGA